MTTKIGRFPYYLETTDGDAYLVYSKRGSRPYWLEYHWKVNQSAYPKTFPTQEDALAFYQDWIDKSDVSRHLIRNVLVAFFEDWEEKHLRICRQHWYAKDLGEPYPHIEGALRKKKEASE